MVCVGRIVRISANILVVVVVKEFRFPISRSLSLSHSDSESAGTAAAVTDSSAPSKVMRDGDQVYDIWVVKVEGERERGSSWKRK